MDGKQDMAQLLDLADINIGDCIAAARSGDTDALYDLGIRYSLGDGVDVDLVEAHKWFNLAVMRGFFAAKDNRAEVAAELTAADISAAQKRARDFLTTCH
jgi:uncharacterized protein